MTAAPTRPAWQPWLPDMAAGAAVAVVGLVEAANTDYVPGSRIELVGVALATAVAVGLSRRLPSAALALVWLTCGYELGHDVPVMVVQLAITVVAFGCARWGRPVTVLLSGLSIPVAGLLAVLYTSANLYSVVINASQYRRLIRTVQDLGPTWQITAAVLATAGLAVPWFAGLTLRFSSRAAASQASQEVAEREAARAQLESEQAREIARLQEDQARLARDVHDVVGHSLAVILAQAESAQFLDEADTEKLRLSMRNIADSARGSLQDVRHVLTSTREPTGPGELTELVEGVRASGHELRFEEAGTPRPLPPELATVAYRVLQEMLTNAIRHGRRDLPASVELHWSGDLRIEVANVVGSTSGHEQGAAEPIGGHGLEGMRRRLDFVGGRLDVRRRQAEDGETFTATAWVPTRTAG
ncbi:signal transduction histidine kinase [Marmoricola sp. URHA0025 HA25]